MPKKSDSGLYAGKQIEQLIDLIYSINKLSIDMQAAPNEIYFSINDVMKALNLSRYHAKKLVNQCVGAGILFKEKLRYRLSAESSIYVLLRQTYRLSTRHTGVKND